MMQPEPAFQIRHQTAAGEVRFVFFGRRGGESAGAFASLNIGASAGDSESAVRGNERAVLAYLGADALYLPRQVHGRGVVRVDEPPAEGVTRGAVADAAVTALSGVALGILTADCLPILFADTATGAVAAAHAGWRGVSADVAGAAIDALDALGARPENLVAAIGPGIGPCCFEVGRDLAGMFRDEVPGGAHAVYDDGTRLTIDLAGIAYRSLIAHGLAAGRVTIVRRCTACEPRAFFSHRRDKGVTGRQIAAVLRAGAKP